MKTMYRTLFLTAGLGFMCWSNISAQSIAGGGWHSLVVCSDSTVKAFGENATGELGDGTNTDRNTPVTAIGLSGMIAVSGGGDQLEAHSLALKSNGTVWSWGSNIYGGLGNGNTNNTNVPGQVLVLSNVMAISAGGWHSVALKKDSTVWTWGWNIDGQIGDGTNVDKTVPVQVPGLTGVKEIAAGTYHVLALKSNGTVWSWGDNINGQLGDGSTADRNAPVQVSGLTGVNPAIVATGAFHCMAVKNDNTVWAWGRNTYGNLGDNTIADKSAPVQMIGMSSVAGLAAGTNFSLLYKSDGTFWGCGRNVSGQLGDGTFTQRNVANHSTGVCPILPIGIIENTAFAKISVFPNPSADGKYTITLLDPLSGIEHAKNCKIEVYNTLGKRVMETGVSMQQLLSFTTIDLFNQPSGMYLMSLHIGEHSINQKLIKQ